MDSKNAIFVVLGLLAMVVHISPEVSARDLTETSTNTKGGVNDVKYGNGDVSDRGNGGYSNGYPDNGDGGYNGDHGDDYPDNGDDFSGGNGGGNTGGYPSNGGSFNGGFYPSHGGGYIGRHHGHHGVYFGGYAGGYNDHHRVQTKDNTRN